MLIHIVKTGETIDKITDAYRILKSDLISNNLHITDFSHLKSGMKLKIPLLSKDILETLEESEAFIDDYYPTFDNFLKTTEEDKSEVVIPEEIITNDNVEEVNLQSVEVKEEVRKVEENVSVNNVYTEPQKPLNNNVYQQYSRSNYCGNVIPDLDQRFIKKI